MRYGLPVSLLMHLAILGWTLIAIERTPPLVEQKPEPVEISVLSEDDIVRLKQGERDAKNLDAEGKAGPAKEPPKKEPPKPTPPPQPQAAAPPPEPEPPKPDPIAEKLAKAAEPPEAAPPAPTPDDKKLIEEKLAEDAEIAARAKAAAEAKAKAEAEAKAKAEHQKKLAEEKRKRDLEEKRRKDLAEKERLKKLAEQKAKAAQSLDSIVNAALDKVTDQSAPPKALIDKAPPKPAQAAGTKTASALKGPAAGAPEGTDNRLTADRLSMLGLLMRNNVKRCWNINAGMEGASKLVIKAQIKLGQDGRLIGDPVIVNTGAGPQFEDAANSARRALIDCQPYTNLPPELYVGGWDFMALTFDPSNMF